MQIRGGLLLTIAVFSALHGKIDAYGRSKSLFECLKVEKSLHTPTQDELFLMASLDTKCTGLPFVVWLSIGNGISHDVKVRVTNRLEVMRSEFITVALRPEVHIIQGSITGSDLQLLTQWMELNLDTIVNYWNCDLGCTIDMIDAIKPLI